MLISTSILVFIIEHSVKYILYLNILECFVFFDCCHCISTHSESTHQNLNHICIYVNKSAPASATCCLLHKQGLETHYYWLQQDLSNVAGHLQNTEQLKIVANYYSNPVVNKRADPSTRAHFAVMWVTAKFLRQSSHQWPGNSQKLTSEAPFGLM